MSASELNIGVLISGSGSTAVRQSLKEAQERSLNASERVRFQGTERFRRDIVPAQFLR